jgi:hypothetical protein
MHQFLPWQARVDGDLYNHGKDGMKTKFDKFIAAHEKEKEVLKDQHKENRGKLNILIALVALLCTIVGTILAVRGFQKTSHLLLLNSNSPAYVEATR